MYSILKSFAGMFFDNELRREVLIVCFCFAFDSGTIWFSYKHFQNFWYIRTYLNIGCILIWTFLDIDILKHMDIFWNIWHILKYFGVLVVRSKLWQFGLFFHLHCLKVEIAWDIFESFEVSQRWSPIQISNQGT